MSYTVPPGAAAPPPAPRPAIVTAACNLLYLIAALQLLNIAASLATVGPMIDVYEEAFRGTGQEGVATVAGAIGVSVAAFGLLIFGGGFLTLGILNAKGKNPARIVTWVVAGLGICCFGSNLTGPIAVGDLGTGTSSGGQVSAVDLQQRVMEALPSWYEPFTLLVNLVALLAAVAAIVLLALPASNAFFRKPQSSPWYPPAYPPIG